MISIEWEDREGARWIELEGELDHEDAAAVKKHVDEAIEGTDGDVVVVVEGVGFIASMVVGVLLQARKRLAEKGRALKLSGVQGTVKTALELMAVDTLFDQVP